MFLQRTDALTSHQVIFAFSFFPTDVLHNNPQWAANFNWAVVIFGTTCILAATYYVLGGCRRYISPASLVREE